MKTQTIDEKLYIEYLDQICLLLGKKAYLIRSSNKYDDSEYNSELREINSKIDMVFSFYQKIRDTLCPPAAYENLSREKIDQYHCSLDTPKCQFPCFGTYEYRGETLPFYLDDYGMDDFIEIKINDKYYQISTAYGRDWWYEVDRLKDLERFLAADTSDLCLSIIDELNERIKNILF